MSSSTTPSSSSVRTSLSGSSSARAAADIMTTSNPSPTPFISVLLVPVFPNFTSFHRNTPPFPLERSPTHQLILFMRRRPARLHPAAQNRTSFGARRGGGAYFGNVCRLSFQNNYPATNKDRLENKNTKDILSPIRLLVKLHISSFTAGASYNW